jgi:hypothetical protein
MKEITLWASIDDLPNIIQRDFCKTIHDNISILVNNLTINSVDRTMADIVWLCNGRNRLDIKAHCFRKLKQIQNSL